eukprot:scaffold2192_cov268-Chaetoceros_neogracile.AAC.64
MNAKGLITFITILYYFYKRYQISSGKWQVARWQGCERRASRERVSCNKIKFFHFLSSSPNKVRVIRY